jgi:hypothetical protein
MMLGGCAHRPAPAIVPPPPPPPPPRIKLAVLPIESEKFPDVAAALNSAFRGVRVKAVDDYFISKVTLEVVQLSIECVEPSSACYVAAGRSLSANKLLLGQVSAAGKRKRDKSVRVTVTLFDVDAAEAVNVVDRVFKTPELAQAGIGELVASATGEAPKPLGQAARESRTPTRPRVAKGVQP